MLAIVLPWKMKDIKKKLQKFKKNFTREKYNNKKNKLIFKELKKIQCLQTLNLKKKIERERDKL